MIITVVGDICLDSIDLDHFELADEIKSLLLSSSIVIGNLEGPITGRSGKQDLLPIQLKSDEKSIELLKYFSAVSLANNHIFDYGMNGFIDTIDYLKKSNLRCWGAGRNACDANSPLEIEKGIPEKIAFITGTRWKNATSHRPGTASFQGHASNIKDLKRKGYFVLYYPHWGYEYISIPPPDVRSHARKMIELGVDLIIGTHPHVLQGYEEYRGKYIFYSLGNFLFHHKHIEMMAPADSHARAKTSIILKFNLKDDAIERLEFLPISISERKIELIRSVKKAEIIDEIIENSQIFKKSQSAYLKKYYSQVSNIVKQNKRIRHEFQQIRKQSFKNKLLIFKGITKQDLLNRLASSLLCCCDKTKMIFEKIQ